MSNNPTKPRLTRRKHKNSRLGCTNCKKRQIKCDESLPICKNCSKRNDACSYLFLSSEEFQQYMKRKNDKNDGGTSNINDVALVFEDHDFANLEYQQPTKEFDIHFQHGTDGNIIINTNNSISTHSSDFIGPSIPIDLNHLININLKKYESSSPETIIDSDDDNTHDDNYDDNHADNYNANHDDNYDDETILLPSSPLLNISTDHFNNAKIVNKTFKINRQSEVEWFDPFLNKIMVTFYHITNKSVTKLFQIFKPFDIDAFIESVYRVQMIYVSLFGRLTRNSMLLLCTDVVKNILFKQNSMLPSISEGIRLKICQSCQLYSEEILLRLSHLIQSKYVINYSKFSKSQREVMFSSFITLSICTPYQYNVGYDQFITLDQTQKCLNYIQTFTNGLYSTIISENKKKRDEQIHTALVYSKHLIQLKKYFIIQNYNPISLIEHNDHLRKLKLFDITGNRHNSWSNAFFILTNFLETHSELSKKFQNSNTLIGYDKNYAISLINEWYQIVRYDLCNFTNYKITSKDRENLILVYFSYLSTRYFLESMIPGIRSFLSTSFIGTDKMSYDVISELIKVYHQLTTNESKLHAIYNIRIITYLTARIDRYRTMVSKISVPEISEMPHLSIDERCESLLNNWKLNNVFLETQQLSFDLNNGTYLTNDNFPIINNGYNSLTSRPGEKINFESDFDLMADFEATNSGFFSKDYDPRLDTFDLSTLADALSNVANEDDSYDKKNMRCLIYINPEFEVNTTSMTNCLNIENYLNK